MEWQNLSALIRCQFAELRLQLVSDLCRELRDLLEHREEGVPGTSPRISSNSQDCHDWLKRHRRSFLSHKIMTMLEDEERTRGMMIQLPTADVHPEPSRPKVTPPPEVPLPELRLAGLEDTKSNGLREVRSYHSTPQSGKRPTRASVMEWAFGLKRQHSPRQTDSASWRGRVRRLVLHPVAESISMAVLLANAVAVGVQTDHMAVQQTPQVPQAWRGVDMAFCIFFSLELVLRLTAFGTKFFRMTGCAWNLLDIILVVAQVTEELLLLVATDAASNADVMRAVRILRVIKVLRLVGTVRMAQDLQLLINCLLLSLKQFLWSALLLMLAIYVMAVYVTQAATAYRLESRDGAYASEIQRWWGSMPQSILSLFEGVSGGVDWHEIAEPLMKGISPWFGLLFVFFMAFCILALLNVITGTFVETMSQQAKDLNLRSRILQARRLFREIDTDASGFISPEEILEHTSSPAVQEFFETIDVHPDEAKNLLEVIDLDGNGKINFEEFLEGSLRLNGAAKSSDLILLAREVKRFHQANLKEMAELARRVREAHTQRPATTEEIC